MICYREFAFIVDLTVLKTISKAAVNVHVVFDNVKRAVLDLQPFASIFVIIFCSLLRIF